MKKIHIMSAYEKIGEIENLLDDACDLFALIPDEIKEQIFEAHTEKESLAHCLRWGSQAATEIRKDWHVVVSVIEVDEEDVK